jgi:hypothetical protein
VLEDSFAENFIPKVHSYVFVDVLNVVSHPSSPIWKKNRKIPNFEEESNQRVDSIFKSSHVFKMKMKLSASYILLMKIFQATNLRMKLRSLHQIYKKILSL